MIFFLILILVASVALGFIILVQNPKGGGLAGNIAGFSNQFMGVKQTTDVLEKGTWVFAVVIALLCLFSAFFIPRTTTNTIDVNARPGTTTSQPATQPNQQPVAPATTPAPTQQPR
ncbi:MAG TPA: preprotein translocase subunit SecG [Chitinophagaceae bacterium]|nr:preprotein translocase subunit SecG [Chitinophagaceae bacterium]